MGKRKSRRTVYVDEYGTVSRNKSTFSDVVELTRKTSSYPLPSSPYLPLPSPQPIEPMEPARMQAVVQEIPETTPAGFINLTSLVRESYVSNVQRKSSRGSRKSAAATTLPLRASQIPAQSSVKPFPTASPTKDFANLNCDTRCPTCGVELRSKNLDRHIKKAHGKSIATSLLASRRKLVPKSDSRSVAEHGATQVQSRQKDALNQNDYESRFGGKYLGYMSRESDGRFGSTSLYDDYSDEANAE